MSKKLKCKDHPTYSGNKVPRANCKQCWKIYLTLHSDKREQYKDIIKKYRFRFSDTSGIQNKCNKHLSYTAKKVPSTGCKKCWEFYKDVNKLTDADIENIKANIELKKQEKKEDVKREEELNDQRNSNLKKLKAMVENNDIVNVAVFINNRKDKVNYSEWLKEVFISDGFTILENPTGLVITGDQSVLYFDDLETIQNAIFPYSRKLKKSINYFIFVASGGSLNKHDGYPVPLFMPDSINTRSMYFDMTSLNKNNFKRVAEKYIQQVYKEKFYLKTLIKQMGETKNE